MITRTMITTMAIVNLTKNQNHFFFLITLKSILISTDPVFKKSTFLFNGSDLSLLKYPISCSIFCFNSDVLFYKAYSLLISWKNMFVLISFLILFHSSELKRLFTLLYSFMYFSESNPLRTKSLNLCLKTM